MNVMIDTTARRGDVQNLDPLGDIQDHSSGHQVETPIQLSQGTEVDNNPRVRSADARQTATQPRQLVHTKNVTFADLFVDKDLKKTDKHYVQLARCVLTVRSKAQPRVPEEARDLITEHIMHVASEHLDKVSTFAVVRPNYSSDVKALEQTWMVVIVATYFYKIAMQRVVPYMERMLIDLISDHGYLIKAGTVTDGESKALMDDSIVEAVFKNKGEPDEDVVDEHIDRAMDALLAQRLLRRDGSLVKNVFVLFKSLELYSAPPDMVFRSLRRPTYNFDVQSTQSQKKYDSMYEFVFMDKTSKPSVQCNTQHIDRSDYYQAHSSKIRSRKMLLISGFVAHSAFTRVCEDTQYTERLIYINGRAINCYSVDDQALRQRQLEQLVSLVRSGKRLQMRTTFVKFLAQKFFESQGTSTYSTSVVRKVLGLQTADDQILPFKVIHQRTIDVIQNVTLYGLIFPLFRESYMSCVDQNTKKTVVYGSGFCRMRYSLSASDICLHPDGNEAFDAGKPKKQVVTSLQPERAMAYMYESLRGQEAVSDLQLMRRITNRLVVQYQKLIDVPSIPLHSLDDQTLYVCTALSLMLVDFIWFGNPSGNHHSFMILGDSGTGKSFYLKMLNQLLGLRVMPAEFVSSRFQGPPLLDTQYGIMADEQNLNTLCSLRQISNTTTTCFDAFKAVLSTPTDGLTVQIKHKDSEEQGFPKGSFVALAGNNSLQSLYQHLAGQDTSHFNGQDPLSFIEPLLRKMTILHTCWRVKAEALQYKLLPSADDMDDPTLKMTESVDVTVQSNHQQRSFDILKKVIIELSFLFTGVLKTDGKSVAYHERVFHKRVDIDQVLRFIAEDVQRGVCPYKKMLLQNKDAQLADEVKTHVYRLWRIVCTFNLTRLANSQGVIQNHPDLNMRDWMARNDAGPVWSSQMNCFMREFHAVSPLLADFVHTGRRLMSRPRPGFSSLFVDTETRYEYKKDPELTKSEWATLLSGYSEYTEKGHWLARMHLRIMRELKNDGVGEQLAHMYYRIQQLRTAYNTGYNLVVDRSFTQGRFTPMQISSFASEDYIRQRSFVKAGELPMRWNLVQIRASAVLALGRQHQGVYRVSQMSLVDFIFATGTFDSIVPLINRLHAAVDWLTTPNEENVNEVMWLVWRAFFEQDTLSWKVVMQYMFPVRELPMDATHVQFCALKFGVEHSKARKGANADISDLRYDKWSLGVYVCTLFAMLLERKMILFQAVGCNPEAYAAVVRAITDEMVGQVTEKFQAPLPAETEKLSSVMKAVQSELSSRWVRQGINVFYTSESKFDAATQIWSRDRVRAPLVEMAQVRKPESDRASRFHEILMSSNEEDDFVISEFQAEGPYKLPRESGLFEGLSVFDQQIDGSIAGTKRVFSELSDRRSDYVYPGNEESVQVSDSSIVRNKNKRTRHL